MLYFGDEHASYHNVIKSTDHGRAWKEHAEKRDMRGMSGDNTFIRLLPPQPRLLRPRPHLPLRPQQQLLQFGPSRVDRPG